MPIPRYLRQLLLAFVFLYLSVVTVVGWGVGKFSGEFLLAQISVWFMIGCLFYPMIWYRREFGFCHPLIFPSLFMFLFFLATRSFVFIFGLRSHMMLPAYSEGQTLVLFAYANFVTAVSFLATYLGFLKGFRIPIPKIRTKEPQALLIWPVILGVFAISAVSFAVYVQLNGGFGGLLLNMARGAGARDIENEESMGLFLVAIKFSAVVALVWLTASRRPMRDPLFWAMTLSGLAMCYLATGKRAEVVYPAAVLIIGWILIRQKVPYLRLVLAAVATFFLVGLMGMYRWTNDTSRVANLDFLSDATTGDVAAQTFEELSRRGGENSTYYAVLAYVPDQVPFLWGRSYLENFYRFVPRVFWPKKPRGIGVQAARTFAGVDYGMPPGAIGEAYWNLGLAAVIIVYFLFGTVLRWLGSLLEAHPRSSAVIVFYSMTLFYLNPGQDGFRMWIQIIIPALIFMRILGMWKFVSSGPKPV